MSILQKSRHWLAPLSLFLLGSTIPPASANSAAATDVTSAGASVHADADGDIHLRVSRDLLTGDPVTLKRALLDVILNGQSHSSQPVSIDDTGRLNYLISLGEDQADTLVSIKPLPASTTLEDTLAMLATGLGTVLTLHIGDWYYHYPSSHKHAYFHLNPEWAEKSRRIPMSGDKKLKVEADNFTGALARNYANQSLLISSMATGEALKGLTARQLEPNITGKPQLSDLVPDAVSALTTGLTGGGIYQLMTDHRGLANMSSINDRHALYLMSSTTTNLSTLIRKAHEVALDHVIDLDDKTLTRVSQAATILENMVALAAMTQLGWVDPSGESYGLSFLPASAAITAIYNFRDITSDLITDATGQRTIGELGAAATMLAGAGISYQIGSKLGGYEGIAQGLTAEATGFSLAMAANLVLDRYIEGDPASPKVRAIKAAAGLATATALHTLARLTSSNWVSLKKVFGNAADGAVILNSLELLMLAKDELVKPYVIRPLLKKAGIEQSSPTPALRLRAHIVQRDVSS